MHAMHHFIITILDHLFPPSADEIIVRHLSLEDVTKKYAHTEHESIISLSSYSDGEIRALVHEAKFHGNKKAFGLLGALFQEYLEKERPTIDSIIPIPLSSSRFRARGYNQVQEVLKTQSLTVMMTIDASVLVRVRNTRPQTELTREERLQNMEQAFAVKDPTLVTGKHILVLDDVTTTGATLRSAETALLAHNPASITLVALAH